MTIVSGGTVVTHGHASSASSWTTTGTPSPVSAGNALLLTVAVDNQSSSDSTTANEVLSITDSLAGAKNVYIKLGEQVNGEAAADAGITVAQFWCPNVNTAFAGDPGETWTVTLANAKTAKVLLVWQFTKAAGTWLWPVTWTSNVQDASNGFGSSAISGLASLSRLYFRSLGKESNSTTVLTPTANFTVGNGTRSSTAGTAVLGRSEWRINTSTGETSDPVMAVSADAAGVFGAYEEVCSKNRGNSVLQAMNRSHHF